METKDNNMKSMKAENRKVHSGLLKNFGRVVILVQTLSTFAAAQSPWETAAKNLQDSFTGPIAKSLSLVAIVIGGLTFAYSEGSSKKQLAGLIFGIGMAVSAASFMSWLFGN